MEKGEAPQMGVDPLLAKWALEEGIIRPDGDGYKLVTTLDDHIARSGNGEGNGIVSDGSSLVIVNENGNSHVNVNGATVEKDAGRRSSRDRTADKPVETNNTANSEPPPPRRANGTSTGPSNIKHGPGYGQAHTGRLRVELQHGDHVTGDDLDDDPASIVVATTAPPRLLDLDDGMDID